MPLPQDPTRSGSTPRETTAAMVANIGRELAEIKQALGRCRGDRQSAAQLTGTWMAHLLISSQALLHNLLIDTAPRPRRITAAPQAGAGPTTES